MKIISYFFFLLLVIVGFGCPENTDPIDSELNIINNSDNVITYSFELRAPNDTALSTIAYPLTLENSEDETVNTKESAVVKEGFKRMNLSKVLGCPEVEFIQDNTAGS